MSATALDHGTALLERARSGGVAALAQLITALESGSEAGQAVRGDVHAAGGHAHIIGVTGAPGSGKSTLVGALAKELRARDRTVAIVAVDPSSSITGGAILGDRIRMLDHTLDPGIYVRSMSSRGSLGGVSRATVDAVGALDAAGWDVVIVETVGVGQAEVEIVQIAHTTAVVSVPGLGDGIQAIKAGLLEVADVHVVNKADRPDANKTIAELKTMLTLAGTPGPGEWALPVLPTSATDGTGVAELADAFDAHLEWMRDAGELERRERKGAAARIRVIARDLIVDRMQAPSHGARFDAAVEDVVARRLDPHAAATALIERVATNHP